MLEMAMINLPQMNAYNDYIKPIFGYHKSHKGKYIPTEAEIKELLPYAEQTKFFIDSFNDIIDDLNYDKEKFEQIIYKLDDDYDMLKEFISTLNPSIKSHYELIKISNEILDKLIKAQTELSIIISQNEHKKS